MTVTNGLRRQIIFEIIKKKIYYLSLIIFKVSYMHLRPTLHVHVIILYPWEIIITASLLLSILYRIEMIVNQYFFSFKTALL